MVNAITRNNRVLEGVRPDSAANRDRRINEGGVFSFSSSESSQELHREFRRRRLEPEVGQEAWVKLYEGTARGTVIDIRENGILMEFPPRERGAKPRQFLYEHGQVFGNFDPEDVNTRTIREAKDPKNLGVIKKNSRISVAYYDKDVEGTVIHVRGNIVEFVPDGESRVAQVNAEICSLVKEKK